MIKLTKEQTKRVTAHKREKSKEKKEKENQLYFMGTIGECPKCSGKEIETDFRLVRCIKCHYLLKK